MRSIVGKSSAVWRCLIFWCILWAFTCGVEARNLPTIPKWTSKFTRMTLESKGLLEKGVDLTPLRKDTGYLFGSECSQSGNETKGVPNVVLFRVDSPEIQGMEITKGTLSLDIRRYDVELDKVDFYYLTMPWNGASSPKQVLHFIGEKKAFASIDLSKQDRGSWESHKVDVTQYLHKASQGWKEVGGFVALGSSSSGSCRARGFTAASEYSPAEGLPRIDIDYKVDMSPPVGKITKQPPPLTNSPTATLHFEGVDLESGVSHFKCRLDDGVFQDCTSPWTYESLEDGSHSFAMTAVDNGGNEGHLVFSETWFVDTVLPRAELVEGHHPEKSSLSRTANFLFNTEDNVKGGTAQMTTECRLNDQDYVLCYSGTPVTFSDLDQGSHDFYVKVIDAAGNVNELKLWSWQVDIPPSCSVLVDKQVDRRGLPSFHFTFAWSEAVRGFSPEGVVVGGVGAELKAWRQMNETHYQSSCEPLTDGDITVQVKTEAAQDMEGNWNIESSNVARVTYDGTPPTCLLKTLHPDNTFSGEFSLTIAWSEDVKNFSPDAIVIKGTSKKVGADFESKFSSDTVGSHFTGTVRPFGIGQLEISVKSNSVVDLSGNENEGGEGRHGKPISCSLNVTISNTDVYYSISGSKSLASISQEALKTFEVVPRNALKMVKLPGEAGALEIDAHNNLFVVVNNQSIYKYEASKMQAMHTVAQSGTIIGLKTDASGRLYVAEGISGKIRVFNVLESSFELLEEFPISASWNFEEKDVGYISMDFDFTNQLLVLNPFEPKLHVFSTEDFSAVKTIDLEKTTPSPLALSVDGRNMVNILDKESKSIHLYGGKDFALIDRKITLEGCEGLLPNRMSIDLFQNIHILDSSKGRVCIFDTKDEKEARIVSLDGSQQLFSLTSFQQLQPPACSILTPTDNLHADFNVTFKWNRPVQGFTVSDIEIGGSGGKILELKAQGDDKLASEFVARVTAGGIGIVSFQIKPYAVQDSTGVWNPVASPISKVSFFGGQCSVELGCQWQLAQYQSQLALDRVQKEVEMELEKEEKAAAIREEARIRAETAIETAKLELEKGKILLEKELIRARIQAEADERIREAKMTEDLRLREIREKGSAFTKTALEVVRTILSSMQSVFEDAQQMKRLVLTLFTLFLAYFVSKETIQVIAKYIGKLLGKPSLLRDTTRGNLQSLLPLPNLPNKKKKTGIKRDGSMFNGIVLCPSLLGQMEIIANSIIGRKQSNLPYRHILFHGMPGTGKTMVAERLAKQCGMDYAIMSGGDVIPLGKTAVTELHRLFNWAERSSKGVLIFIDEAEAFLQRRTGGVQQSEYMKSAINALLSRTGQPTRKFMLVLATNRPQDLDSAVLDRIDDSIAFPLPGEKEREALVELYFTNYVGSIAKLPQGINGSQIPGWTSAIVKEDRSFIQKQFFSLFPSLDTPKKITLVGFPQENTFKVLGHMAKGFSGREISKLVSSVQTYASSIDQNGSSSLYWTRCLSVVETKVKEHTIKRSFYE